MGKFTFTQTEIPGVVVIEPQVFGDDRGYFMETYQKDQFAEAGIDKEFVQDNQSRSTRGVLRGLHFQKNHTQGKLVRVTRGEVYDVAVDCRPNSASIFPIHSIFRLLYFLLTLVQRNLLDIIVFRIEGIQLYRGGAIVHEKSPLPNSRQVSRGSSAAALACA